MEIICEKLTKIYRQGDREDVTAVNDCAWHLPTGSITVLLGVSGSGKSTLLRLLGLQEQPTSGRILFDGEDVTALDESAWARIRAHRIGFIHQNYRLIPMLSVEENILLPRRIIGQCCDEEELKKLAALLHIENKLANFPASLSGGQQQRVAIARALINHPPLILADEPTGNLDSGTKQAMIELFSKVHQLYSPTVVIVTHDHALTAIADQVYQMENGHPILRTR